MKIISFSLWGNNPKYCIGAIENIKLAKEIYPDWTCRFYFDNSVPVDIIEQIKNMNQETIKVTDGNYGMFWRFYPVDDPSVDIVISRDTDSRLNYRERAAVDEWLRSDKCFHVMHDHQFHVYHSILGGMWGAKKGCICDIKQKMEKWSCQHRYSADEDFLDNEIWPIIKSKCMSHTSIWNLWQGWKPTTPELPFPQHIPFKEEGFFVGQAFTHDNIPLQKR